MRYAYYTLPSYLSMSNNSDPAFNQYSKMDFADTKPVDEIPALAILQAAQDGKSHITMRVDNATLAIFKARAAMTGGNYQTLMNEALTRFAQGLTLADVVRETIRQELHRA
jgi:predicted DNA binding CopG/RHH family protein